MGDLVLSDAMGVLERDDELFLPVEEFASLLNLAVKNRGKGEAGGYLMDEARTIEIDGLAGRVTLEGKVTAFDRRLVIVQPDGLYVAKSLLDHWFPVNISYEQAQQIIRLEAREKLPLQQLLERRARFQNVKPAALDLDPSYREVTTPHRLLAPPVIDFTSAVDFSGSGLATIQQRQSFIAAGDLAGLSTTLNVASVNSELERTDFTAGRVDSRGTLLGPLHATRFAVGAVQTPAFAGISQDSSPLYGVLVSNRPTNLPTQFTTHDIQGPLPPGWDAELYYNGVPTGYQAGPKDGLYRFNNLPLRIGLNDFRLVLHGPNGETRVEQQSFLLDGLMVQPGQVQYTFGANHDLLGSGRTANALATADFGFSKELSGFLGSLTVADDRTGQLTHYADAGLKGSAGASFLTLDHVRSSAGGSATLFTAKGYASGLYASLSETFLDRFASQLFPNTFNPVVSETSLKLEGSLPLDVRLPFGVESNLELRQSGPVIPSFVGRLSGEIGGVSVSQQVVAHLDPQALSTVGITQLGTTLRGVSLRGQVNYVLAPGVSPSTIQLAASKDLGARYQLSGQVSHDPAAGVYDFSAGLARRLGGVGVLISAGMSSTGTYSVSTQLSVSAGRDPRGGAIYCDPFPLAPYGGVTLLAYLDENANGAYDPGEQLLEGVRFVVNGGVSLGATGKDGVLVIKQLPVGTPLNISVFAESVSEPFLVPVARGFRVEPRPGVTTVIDFGFVPSGEVDGIVEFKSGKEVVPVAEVGVALMDSRGRLLETAKSDRSGYFLFKKVKGGVYIVGLGAGEAERLLVYQEKPVVFVMPADGDMLSGNDLTLLRAGALPQVRVESRAPP